MDPQGNALLQALGGNPAMPGKYPGFNNATPAGLAQGLIGSAMPNATMGDATRRQSAQNMLPALLQQQQQFQDQQRQGAQAMKTPGIPGFGGGLGSGTSVYLPSAGG